MYEIIINEMILFNNWLINNKSGNKEVYKKE